MAPRLVHAAGVGTRIRRPRGRRPRRTAPRRLSGARIVVPTTLVFLDIGDALSTTGPGSLGGVWTVLLPLGIVAAVLVLLSVYWLRYTLSLIFGRSRKLQVSKRYVASSVAIAIACVAGAFTFHPNAPYDQNTGFASAAFLVLLGFVAAVSRDRSKSRSEGRRRGDR